MPTFSLEDAVSSPKSFGLDEAIGTPEAGNNFVLRPPLEPTQSPEEQSYRNMVIGQSLGLPTATGPAPSLATPFTPLVTLPKYESPPPMMGKAPGWMETAGGLYNTGAGLTESFTSPAAIASLGIGAAGPALAKVIGGLWAAKIASDLPEQTKQSWQTLQDPNAPLSKKVEAGIGPSLAGLLAGSLGAHTFEGQLPITPRLLPPEAQQPLYMLPEKSLSTMEAERTQNEPWDFLRKPLPEGRGTYAETPGSGKTVEPQPETQPGQRLIPERSSAYDQPITVNDIGQAIDLRQLSPEELNAFNQRTRYVAPPPRETYVRPAQEPPAPITILPPQFIKSVDVLPGGEITPASQAATAPRLSEAGGEISFNSPAAAGAIPSAGQAATEVPGVSPIRQAPDAMIQQVTDIVTSKDVRMLADLRSQLAAQTPFTALPGQVADSIRLINQRLTELQTGRTLPETQRLREIIGAAEERPAKKPLQPMEVKVSPPGQKLLGEPENASTVSSPKEEVSGQGLQREGLGKPRSEDLQRNEARGESTSNPELRQDEGKTAEGQDVTKLYSLEGLLFDPEFYRSTARKAKLAAQFLHEKLKGLKQEELPNLVFNTRDPLPDLQDKPLANKIASQSFGTERVPGLGVALGGKARIRTPQDEVVAARQHEYHGVAPAMASMTGELVRNKINDVFKANENGDLNVRPTRPNQSLKIGDVFETLQRSPNSYMLTPDQRYAFTRVLKPVLDGMQRLANKYGIASEDTEGGYFTRVVTEHPRDVERISGTGGGSLTKTFVERGRAFKTEQEGWNKGYKYSLDPEKRLVSGVEALYKAIANRRMVNDPALGARTPNQVMGELRQTYAADIASGDMTEAQLDRILKGVQARGMVHQPLLMSHIFPPKVAKMLNREFMVENNRVIKALATASSFSKSLKLGFDFGVGQLQLLPTLFNNPRIWAQANFESLKNMASQKFFADYVRNHAESVSQLAQLGIPVGKLQEMVEGSGQGELITKIPVVGPVAKAFGRQFQGALDVAKVELWESMRDNTPTKDWPRLAQAIEGMLLSGRLESGMVGKGRAQLERTALLATTYYRATLNNLTAALIEKGEPGKQTRLALAKFAIGGTALFVGIGLKLGMSTDEIKRRLDPRQSDYMTWQIRHEDGSQVNVGFGGIHRSLIRLLGKVVTTSSENPKNFLSGSSEKNPLMAWYRGHAGPIPSIGWEFATGKDFMGRESDIRDVGAGSLPLTAGQFIRKEGDIPPKPEEYASQFLGLTAFPESFSKRQARTLDANAQNKFGKPYDELSVEKRFTVERLTQSQLKGEPTGMTPEKSRELAQRKEDERTGQLLSALPKEVTQWAKDNNVNISGYQATKEKLGTHIGITDEERQLLHDSMVAEYTKALTKLKSMHKVEVADPLSAQREVDAYTELARARAWATVQRKIKANAKAAKSPTGQP